MFKTRDSLLQSKCDNGMYKYSNVLYIKNLVQKAELKKHKKS